MALLSLKDIGKIYVSEGNVAVGIRGVNLSFERGEFVAITGKSGSGKSTLLNVISGMDSYEEGELFIEGEPTSHYLQPEWEEYREKYISFIFQDYNIIESFTVLQNVELALMHIDDKKQRRARALELINRVGLSSHIKQKGSRLSGGQKQRTVIARALAKDSPIILADEPTGNLDSATSKEIIELLREVSRDKLLIVVTHNFEQVEEHATRHIRVFDGAIESDHVVKAPDVGQESKSESAPSKKGERGRLFKNGLVLGRTIFTSKPRLSLFLCLLMIVGAFGIFLITSLCGDATDMFEPTYMFDHIDGRVVVTTQNGEVMSEDRVKALASEYGAKSYLRFDSLLDEGWSQSVVLPFSNNPIDHEYAYMRSTYGKTYGDDILGKYPEKANEVLLYLPISYQPAVGKDEIKLSEILMSRMNFKVTGVKYYYDNNIEPECLFTEEGFKTATAIHYLMSSSTSISITVFSEGMQSSYQIYDFVPSFDMPADKIYVDSKSYSYFKDSLPEDAEYTEKLSFNAAYYTYDYYGGMVGEALNFNRSFESDSFTDVRPVMNTYGSYEYENLSDFVIMSDEIIRDMAEQVLNVSYRQMSLFFENDRAAKEASEELQRAGYIAVPSYTTYEPDALEAIVTVLSCIMVAVVWVLGIVFLAFFINLCSSRTLGAFKGDMAIMRSMGIPVKVIRVGMYVRMLIALIPAFVLVSVTAVLIFTTPTFNGFFIYLYPWQYVVIYIGMILLTVRITHKQIRKLFGQSVKKSLKGGNAE